MNSVSAVDALNPFYLSKKFFWDPVFVAWQEVLGQVVLPTLTSSVARPGQNYFKSYMPGVLWLEAAQQFFLPSPPSSRIERASPQAQTLQDRLRERLSEGESASASWLLNNQRKHLLHVAIMWDDHDIAPVGEDFAPKQFRPVRQLGADCIKTGVFDLSARGLSAVLTEQLEAYFTKLRAPREDSTGKTTSPADKSYVVVTYLPALAPAALARYAQFNPFPDRWVFGADDRREGSQAIRLFASTIDTIHRSAFPSSHALPEKMEALFGLNTLRSPKTETDSSNAVERPRPSSENWRLAQEVRNVFGVVPH